MNLILKSFKQYAQNRISSAQILIFIFYFISSLISLFIDPKIFLFTLQFKFYPLYFIDPQKSQCSLSVSTYWINKVEYWNKGGRQRRKENSTEGKGKERIKKIIQKDDSWGVFALDTLIDSKNNRELKLWVLVFVCGGLILSPFLFGKTIGESFFIGFICSIDCVNSSGVLLFQAIFCLKFVFYFCYPEVLLKLVEFCARFEVGLVIDCWGFGFDW